MTAAPQRLGLVIRDSFLGGNPNHPIDPARLETERVRLASLTGRDIRYLHYDKLANDDPAFCHAHFLDAVDGLRPEFVWYHPSTVFPLIHRNLRAEVLFAARTLYHPRLVFSFDDLATPFLATYLSGYAAIGDVLVASDGNGARLQPMAPGKLVLDLWPRIDPDVFRDPRMERDVDVCFVGSLDRHPDRRSMLAELERLGVAVVCSDDDGDVGLLNRSKISLNFSETRGGVHRLNARAIESILSGALLFESENAVTSRYLAPYRHYVPFGTAADLAAKIRRYLANDPARRAIVAAAGKHVGTNLSDRLWWGRVLEAVDRALLEAATRRATPA